MSGPSNPAGNNSATEDMYRWIVDAVPEGIWIVDAQGQTIFSNRRMAEILGVAYETMPRQSCFDCLFQGDEEDARRHFDRTFAGDPRPFDFRLRRGDGSPVWVRISCRSVLDGEGAAIGLLGLFSDISEHKRAEKILRESEERFRNLVDTAPVMTWMSGPEKQGTFYNTQAAAFAGVPAEELIGDGYARLLHPDDRERYLAVTFAAADARAPFSTTARFRRADGEYRTILVSGVPRVADGDYLGHIGTGIDITDLKRGYEQDLTTRKMESLSALAVGMAHDCNSLLGAILAHAEYAQAVLDAASPAAEPLANIAELATRIAKSVSGLMTFGRQESAPYAPTDLSRLVAETIDLVKISISTLAVLTTDLSPDLPPVCANAVELRQVIMHLVLNASEALAGKPGAITIRTELVPQAGSARAAIRLEVRDTGLGMADDVKSKIFDPFFSTRSVGRGLGLSSVQGIVRRHGGSIEVESAPGQGSRFAILLPCTEPAERSDAQQDVCVRPGRTVLFIEDDVALRSAVAKLLRRRDFHVIEAADGMSGLETFHANPNGIDVVLLDVMLPGMSGQVIFEELRRSRPDLYVVLSTAYNRERVFLEFAELQPWAFIRKPYQINELVQLLEEAGSAQPFDGT